MFSEENKWVPYAYTGISAMGVVANYKSFKYIGKTFNVKDNLINALSKDSFISMLGNGFFCASGLIWSINDQILKSKIGCCFTLSGLYVPIFTGNFDQVFNSTESDQVTWHISW